MLDIKYCLISVLLCVSLIARVRVLSHVQLSGTHGLQPAGLLCPWNFPGKNTGITISFSRGSAQPRGQTCVSGIGRQIFTAEPPGSPLKIVSYFNFTLCFSACSV